jgi:hypothetical protein
MPYIIRPRRFPSKALAACGAVLMLGATSAQAAEITSPSQCKESPLSQPYLADGDSNYYMLVPGETPNNFTGAGWKLSGGASMKKTTIGDGKAGSVLDLPSRASAVSPNFCVTQAYPTARPMVRDVAGSEGVSFAVSYAGTNTWATPKNTGQVHGNGAEWTAVTPVNMQPAAVVGWQVVHLTLVGGGNTSEFQLYNLYIDPYRR